MASLRTRVPFALAGLTASAALVPVVISAPAMAAPMCRGEVATIVGTSGDDELTGTPARDVVAAGAGDDVFNDLLGGDDLVCGGPGDDILRGGSGDDSLFGGAGADELAGEGGDDRLVGGAGKDRLAGGEGADVVRGNQGADYLVGGGDGDRIDGGRGVDWLTYLFLADPVEVDARVAEVTGAGVDLYGGVETIEGSTGPDVMRGSSGSEDFRGGGGEDRIMGKGGIDILFADGGTVAGGGGNDFIRVDGTAVANGGGGADEIDLGRGTPTARGGRGKDDFVVVSRRTGASISDTGGVNDRVNFSRLRRSVRVHLGRGRATWKGGSLRIQGIRNVLGSRRADTLIGGPGTDYLDGAAGSDVLRGRGGADFLLGRQGYDRGFGDGGRDICLTEQRVGCES